MRTTYLATAALAALLWSGAALAGGSASIPVQPPCNCKPGTAGGDHHGGPPPQRHGGPERHAGPGPEQHDGGEHRWRHHRHWHGGHGHGYARGDERDYAEDTGRDDRDSDRADRDYDRGDNDGGRHHSWHRHWSWHHHGWRGRRWAEGSVDLYGYNGGSRYRDDRDHYGRHEHGWQDGYGRWHDEGTADAEEFAWRMDPWHGYHAHCRDAERDRLIDHDNDGY